MHRSLLAAILAAASPASVAAQTDYRNLDDERPLVTEDAYTLERGAFEVMFPYTLERSGAGDLHAHLLSPELGLGLDNAQLSFKWPLVFESDGAFRSLGPRLGILYNPFTQPRGWPAFALRVDGALIEGADGASDARVTGKAILTRSLGVTRLHANLAFTAGPESPASGIEFPPRTTYALAIDHTLWRRSLWLGAEVGGVQMTAGATTDLLLGAGLRWQWTPVDVVDLGVRSAHDQELTIGLTHVFGRGRPSRREAPGGVPSLDRRDEQFYTPGPFNWSFLRREAEAARLFNAFDYGHAVLYERLLTRRGPELDSVLAEEYRFLTSDLLVHPPRFQVAEEAVMPRYAETAWRAKQVFEWAHLLHRQIYDVYTDCAARSDGCGPAAADSLIEALTDRYLARREYALAPVPKAMALMEGQPYSGLFAKAEPQFNGLIWAYHWLQVGLYEPYAGDVARRRGSGVVTEFQPVRLEPVLTHFRRMLETERFPEVMPMTSAVAPEFTRAHPRAAAIFDNLHSLHDVISDILLNDAVVPSARKRATIYRAIAEYQDPTRDVESAEHWRMMGEMVGGVERMGGAVPR
jgi:hypothetical protein